MIAQRLRLQAIESSGRLVGFELAVPEFRVDFGVSATEDRKLFRAEVPDLLLQLLDGAHVAFCSVPEYTLTRAGAGPRLIDCTPVPPRDPRLARLRALLRERAVQFGEFTLASGAKSDVYIDGRLLTLSAEGAKLVAGMLWERIAPLRPDAVGGMTMGADPIVGALLAVADTPLLGFLVRKEPKGHGTRKSVEGPRPDKARPRVVLVDDTVTTGGSTLKAIKAVREEWSAEVVGAFAIVDRETGAPEAFAQEGVPFEALLRLGELR